MQAYHDLLKHILQHGERRTDRTGVGTIGIFGYQMRFNLQEGFPLVTTKKVHLKSVIHELLWFLQGSTNIKYLTDNGVSIWNEWADDKGELGPVYGKQWRSWEGANNQIIDQITGLMNEIKRNPYSRRLIISAWNVADIQHMALPPCHTLFQFYVSAPQSGGQRPKLSCQLYQRSADTFLGVPFNIASYALLTLMIAHVCDMDAGDFVHTFGDAHIYLNHLDQVNELLSRTPKALPQMQLNPAVKDIFGFTYNDFTLTNYDPYPAIKAPVAV